MLSYGREMAGKFLHFFLLLFDSIGGAVELALSRNKVHKKNEKSVFRKIFVARYIPILQYCRIGN